MDWLCIVVCKGEFSGIYSVQYVSCTNTAVIKNDHIDHRLFLLNIAGDNLIIGSYDKRLCWFDMDLSSKPYRIIRSFFRV